MIISGKNVQIELNSVARTIADTISVEITDMFLTYRDYQGILHYYDKKPKISGSISEFIDDFDTLNDFILTAKITSLDIISDTGTKLKLRLKDVIFDSLDFEVQPKKLLNTEVTFKADDYEILSS